MATLRHKARKAWYDAWFRCHSGKSIKKPTYQDRGIVMDQAWIGDPDPQKKCTRGFLQFLADMGLPKEGDSIERKNNDGPYSASNCCWIPVARQARNTTRTRRPKRRRVRLNETVPISARQ